MDCGTTKIHMIVNCDSTFTFGDTTLRVDVPILSQITVKNSGGRGKDREGSIQVPFRMRTTEESRPTPVHF